MNMHASSMHLQDQQPSLSMGNSLGYEKLWSFKHYYQQPEPAATWSNSREERKTKSWEEMVCAGGGAQWPKVIVNLVTADSNIVEERRRGIGLVITETGDNLDEDEMRQHVDTWGGQSTSKQSNDRLTTWIQNMAIQCDHLEEFYFETLLLVRSL